MLMAPSTTIRVFGVYLGVAGITLLWRPDILFMMVGMAYGPNELLVLLGGVMILFSIYYLNATRQNCRVFAQGTVLGRFVIFGIVVWAVMTGQLAWNYLLIVGLEPLGAIWTAAALWRTRTRRGGAAQS